MKPESERLRDGWIPEPKATPVIWKPKTFLSRSSMLSWSYGLMLTTSIESSGSFEEKETKGSRNRETKRVRNRKPESQWKVDRVLAIHSLSSTASQGTSNIPFPWLLLLGCNRRIPSFNAMPPMDRRL